MYLLNFEQWVSSVFVNALGTTFAHSLWQALIALIICHISLSVAKKASPALRYNLLITISAGLAVTVAITFLLQLNTASASKDIPLSYAPLEDILNSSSDTAMPVVIQSQKFLSLVTGFFSRYMDVFVALWFIIFCFKWLRLTLGINYIKRIARFESSVAEYDWLEKLEQLKRKLGVTGQVQLLKSYMINIPMVSGYFKPVIIVPASLFSNMPPDVVESILLHELAHIKRRDYIMNIMQSVAETIFFFNPFILKISSLIKDERENCCDTLAVEIVQNKVSYVEALVAFGEYSSKAHTALAFPGRKNYLLQRVKRILYNQNKKPGVMEKSILACGMILFLGLAVFSTVTGTEKVLNSSLVSNLREAVQDTVPSKEPNKKPTAREVRRAEKAIREHELKVAKKQKELQAAVEAMQEDLEKMQKELGENVEINEQQIQELIDNKLNLENELNAPIKTDVNVNLEHLDELNLQNAKLQKELALLHVEKVKPALEAAMADVKIRQAEIIAANEERFKVQQLILDSLSKNMKLNLITNFGPVTSDEISDILDFLEANKVAKRNEIKSFSLNESELKVNDVKQPAPLHEELKKKYIQSKDDYINFLRHDKNTSISIRRNRPDPV